LSEYHFQRLFTRWLNQPQEIRRRTKENAKHMLRAVCQPLDASYASGLGSRTPA
jgi:hypothetical protein